jgi:hypothetical protein
VNLKLRVLALAALHRYGDSRRSRQSITNRKFRASEKDAKCRSELHASLAGRPLVTLSWPRRLRRGPRPAARTGDSCHYSDSDRDSARVRSYESGPVDSEKLRA